MPVTVFDFSSMGDELTPAQVATSSQAAQEEQQRRQDWHNSLKFQYRMHPKQPFVTLNNGRDMPRMGLGTWCVCLRFFIYVSRPLDCPPEAHWEVQHCGQHATPDPVNDERSISCR